MPTLNEQAIEYTKEPTNHASFHSNPRLAKEDLIRRAFLAGAAAGAREERERFLEITRRVDAEHLDRRATIDEIERRIRRRGEREENANAE